MHGSSDPPVEAQWLGGGSGRPGTLDWQLWAGTLDLTYSCWICLLQGSEDGLLVDDEEGANSESASPTIPALRSTPFQQAGPPLFTGSRPGAPLEVPRLPLSAKTQPSGRSQPEAAAAVAVPRLHLTAGMHSNLAMRTASADLAVTAEAEQARRQAGRSFFGELEKSALGKGKMQAASVAQHRRGCSMSGECRLWGGRGRAFSMCPALQEGRKQVHAAHLAVPCQGPDALPPPPLLPHPPCRCERPCG